MLKCALALAKFSPAALAELVARVCRDQAPGDLAPACLGGTGAPVA